MSWRQRAALWLADSAGCPLFAWWVYPHFRIRMTYPEMCGALDPQHWDIAETIKMKTKGIPQLALGEQSVEFRVKSDYPIS